jgi:Protein of unknown function (DUF3500)
MSVPLRLAAFMLLCSCFCVSMVTARYKLISSGETMTAAAEKFLSSLSAEQQTQTLLAYDAANRVDWHFIPKPTRKGLQLKEMNAGQRKLAHDLLRSCLSEIGYDKAVKIIALEELLRVLEINRKGGPLRDTERYYFTLFGKPASDTKWGLSIEGHHLSLNFVVDKGTVVSCSPIALCTNPAKVMKSDVPSIPAGLRLLAAEEDIAFELLGSLDAEQKKIAIFAEKALSEVRAAGEPQPPQEKPVGIPFAKLTKEQQALLKKLVETYTGNLPADVAEKHWKDFQPEDWQSLHFGWAGAEQPGVGHYYRVQGRTFLIELVNTQPDAAGNPANHVHCVWRNMLGDFGLPSVK